MTEWPPVYEFKVNAGKSPDSEHVHLKFSAEHLYGHLFLSREQAYDLAQQLQHQADWLRRMDKRG